MKRTRGSARFPVCRLRRARGRGSAFEPFAGAAFDGGAGPKSSGLVGESGCPRQGEPCARALRSGRHADRLGSPRALCGKSRPRGPAHQARARDPREPRAACSNRPSFRNPLPVAQPRRSPRPNSGTASACTPTRARGRPTCSTPCAMRSSWVGGPSGRPLRTASAEFSPGWSAPADRDRRRPLASPADPSVIGFERTTPFRLDGVGSLHSSRIPPPPPPSSTSRATLGPGAAPDLGTTIAILGPRGRRVLQ